MKNELKKDLNYYVGLPYTVVMRRDEEGDIVARIDELPGCVAHGGSEAEALQNLKEIQKLWIEDCLESGQDIPLPEPDEDLPSGKWLQRVPRSLHKRLVVLARKEKVSLNQLVTTMLSHATATRSLTEVLAQNISVFAGMVSAPRISRGDPWDAFRLVAAERWLVTNHYSGQDFFSALERVKMLGSPDDKQSFPLNDAYKKEIADYY